METVNEMLYFTWAIAGIISILCGVKWGKASKNKLKCGKTKILFIFSLIAQLLCFTGLETLPSSETHLPYKGTEKFANYETNVEYNGDNKLIINGENKNIKVSDIPEYSGIPYVEINDNIPFFDDKDLSLNSYELYGELDNLGRCTGAMANIGKDLMPTEERGSISEVKPTGWHAVKYEGIDGKYLYNRAHLIGYQLTAENANKNNLITGTRYMNVSGMLPFENMVADYIKETNNHVLYRVTPIFDGNNLLASGVLMEAESVEDKGEDILFNVYCYNVQPNIKINYANGDSTEDTTFSDSNKVHLILNTKTKKYHLLTCSSVENISDANKKEYNGNLATLVSQGYTACKACN